MKTYYKYVDHESLTKILEGQSLKVTNPVDFNDPFDCDLPRMDIESQQLCDEILDGISKDFKDNNVFNSAIDEMLKPLLSLIHDPVKEMLNGWDKVINNFRILALTTKSTNILMWSHYANNHTGAVLELAFDTNERNLIAKVEYCPKQTLLKDIISGFLKKTFSSAFKKPDFKPSEIFSLFPEMQKDAAIFFNELEYRVANFLIQKLNIWQYEEEHRMLLQKDHKNLTKIGNMDLLPIKPHNLTSVIFGVNSSQKMQNDIMSLLRDFYPNTKVSQAFKDHWCIKINTNQMQ